jgi:hypothetical protein
MWIFTPVKSVGTLLADSVVPGQPHWYYVGVNTYGVIDLRVIAAEFIVMCTLMIAIPFWSYRRGRFGATVGIIAASTGAAFGLSIGAISPYVGGRPIVSVLYYIATAILCGISVATITLAHSRQPASR